VTVWNQAYARVIAAYPEVSFRRGRPADLGWASAADVGVDGSAFASLVADEARAIRDSWAEEPRPYVAATRAMIHYAYYAAVTVAGPYLVAGLVPELGPEDYAARLSNPVAIVAEPRGWTDVTVVGADAARAELRRVHAGLVAPVFAAGRVASRRAPVALWRQAADALAGALWRLGERLHDDRAAAAEAALVLGDLPGGGPIAPYTGGANFREVTRPDGTRLLTRERNDCCLAYTLNGPGPCATCPRLDETARAQLMLN
jgi:hypothetical protein